MAKALSAEAWDKPIVFLFVVTMGVVAMMAFMSWAFTAAGLSGPLSLVKGGAMHG